MDASLLLNGVKVYAKVVKGYKYLDERFFSPVYALHSIGLEAPTCYGEFEDGTEFKLVVDVDGNLLAVTEG